MISLLLAGCKENSIISEEKVIDETMITEESSTDEVVTMEEISSANYSNSKMYDVLFPVYINGYGEYMDINGNVVTDYKFERVDSFNEGMALVKKDGFVGAMDLSCNITVPIKYRYLEPFHCGLAVATNDEEMKGYINTSGEIVIPFEYVFARSFSEDIAIVSRNYREYEFIDKDGNALGYAEFRHVLNWGDFHEGFMINTNAYYNINGECVIGNNIYVDYAEGFYPSDFHEGMAVYPLLKTSYVQSASYLEGNVEEFFNSDNWYYIYIDKQGNDVLQKKFDNAGNFSEGLAVVRIGEKTGCIDHTGNFVFYHDGIDNCYEYSEGYLPFCKNENGIYKFGFLDKNGKETIPAEYYNYNGVGFCNGLALVAENKESTKWSYINGDNVRVFTFFVDDGYKIRFPSELE